MTIENPQAFPFSAEYGHPAACGGMTLRDYFAAPIMAKIFEGIGALGDFSRQERDDAYVEAAVEAYAAADAMLAVRQEPST